MATVLLVEDDVDVRFLLEHVLIEAGHTVVAVETVASAVKLVNSRPFDVVVADGLLGDGTGLDVAEQASKRGMKTLIITGNAFALSEEQLRKHAYVLKPVRGGELVDMVRRLLWEDRDRGGVVPFPKTS